ncbi:hypothetical protein E4U60_006561 [Claviceps pazoutovae]|uniref:Uncharacterized protein n=1 Tax=Claviceps pazoutovae TaxID=1649127 RepID=A0A9P7M6R3_9HYPO|nr:hypothetical protein E4U60_006561 [Claviceps pazoutovae]
MPDYNASEPHDGTNVVAPTPHESPTPHNEIEVVTPTSHASPTRHNEVEVMTPTPHEPPKPYREMEEVTPTPQQEADVETPTSAELEQGHLKADVQIFEEKSSVQAPMYFTRSVRKRSWSDLEEEKREAKKIRAMIAQILGITYDATHETAFPAGIALKGPTEEEVATAFVADFMGN